MEQGRKSEISQGSMEHATPLAPWGVLVRAHGKQLLEYAVFL